MKKIPHISCKNCEARLQSVFCELKAEELDSIEVGKSCMVYGKGQVVFQEGTMPFGLYCINSGKVKISTLGQEGKEQILRFAKNGDVVGYRALLSGDHYSASAVALEESNICFLPSASIQDLIRRNGHFAMELMKLLSENLKDAEKRLTHIAQKPVRERMAEAILFLKETYGLEPDGKTLNVSLSREEIANIVGTATETAIRLLSEFKNDHLIELNNKRISILDAKGLVRTANVQD